MAPVFAAARTVPRCCGGRLNKQQGPSPRGRSVFPPLRSGPPEACLSLARDGDNTPTIYACTCHTLTLRQAKSRSGPFASDHSTINADAGTQTLTNATLSSDRFESDTLFLAFENDFRLREDDYPEPAVRSALTRKASGAASPAAMAPLSAGEGLSENQTTFMQISFPPRKRFYSNALFLTQMVKPI